MTVTDRGVVLFDGYCGFCTWSVEFARKRVGSTIDFIAFQSVDVQDFGLTVQACEREVQYVGPQGVRSGERAVAAVLASGTGPWPHLGWLIDVPVVRPVAGVMYRFVAHHRGRLWGVTPALSARRPEDATGS